MYASKMMLSSQFYLTKVYFLTLAAILFCCIGTCNSSQPPYQVSLYVSLHPRAPPIHYCNGVIVQSRLVLTTASCIFYQSSVMEASGTAAVQIPAGKISVVPGIAGNYNVVNTFDVLEVKIAKGFNITTLSNNLALLRLDASLPLGQSDAVQWIILDEYEYEAEGLYMAGFPSLNVDPNIMLWENVRILPNEECAQPNRVASNIENDSICARYPNTYAVGPDCELPADFNVFNADYGTGLIIKSHLIALFSHTIATTPNPNVNNCRDRQPLKAVFATVEPHLDWIYDIVAAEEKLAFNQQDLTFSAPYQQRGSSAIKSILSSAPAIETTKTTTTSAPITTTVAAFVIAANEPTANPSTTEVNAPQSLSVSETNKAVDLLNSSASWRNALLLLILAQLIN